jgi:hypothetical protein
MQAMWNAFASQCSRVAPLLTMISTAYIHNAGVVQDQGSHYHMYL